MEVIILLMVKIIKNGISLMIVMSTLSVRMTLKGQAPICYFIGERIHFLLNESFYEL